MSESEWSPDVERRIEEHFDAIDRALAAKGVSLNERRSVTDDVEAQIRDMLGAGGSDAPTLADLEAVLSRLDDPESYAEEIEGKSIIPTEHVITLRARATGPGQIVKWSKFKKGELAPGSRWKNFFLTTILTNIVSDVIAQAKRIDPACTVTPLFPNGFTTASFDIAIRGKGFQVMCGRRLVRGMFPLNPIAAEFGRNYDVLLTIAADELEVAKKFAGEIRGKYVCDIETEDTRPANGSQGFGEYSFVQHDAMMPSKYLTALGGFNFVLGVIAVVAGGMACASNDALPGGIFLLGIGGILLVGAFVRSLGRLCMFTALGIVLFAFATWWLLTEPAYQAEERHQASAPQAIPTVGHASIPSTQTANHGTTIQMGSETLYRSGDQWVFEFRADGERCVIVGDGVSFGSREPHHIIVKLDQWTTIIVPTNGDQRVLVVYPGGYTDVKIDLAGLETPEEVLQAVMAKKELWRDRNR